MEQYHRRLTTKKKPMLIILAVRFTLWLASPRRSISCWERTSPTPTREPGREGVKMREGERERGCQSGICLPPLPSVKTHTQVTTPGATDKKHSFRFLPPHSLPTDWEMRCAIWGLGLIYSVRITNTDFVTLTHQSHYLPNFFFFFF